MLMEMAWVGEVDGGTIFSGLLQGAWGIRGDVRRGGFCLASRSGNNELAFQAGYEERRLDLKRCLETLLVCVMWVSSGWDVS